MPFQIIRQDITKMKVDAIVNTTNSEMIGYNGVDLAIHNAAGPELDKECEKIAPLGRGTAKITNGYNLDAKYIIHTSGPVWQGGLVGESIILKSCYIESLKLAAEKGCSTVAFPLISSGTYGYPKDKVLHFAIEVITEFLLEHELTVYLCVFDKNSYEFSKKLFSDISEFIDDEYAKEKLNYDFFELNCVCNAAPTTEKTEKSEYRKSNRISKTRETTAEKNDGNSLEDYLKSMDKPFGLRLFDLIDQKGMTDVECYKKANVDRKTFSKIKSNPSKYKPSKPTAVAFAIALKLNLDETQELLATAGYALSKSNKFDIIIRYFIINKKYDVALINEALFEFDQVCLGNCVG